MDEKDFAKMIVSNFILIEANQIVVMEKLRRKVCETGPCPPDRAIATTIKQIDNLKKLMCELNNPYIIVTLGNQG